MKTIQFTPIEMRQALEAIGYELKEETVMVDDRYGEDKPYRVWNVYLKGELQCGWGATGCFRVEWVFYQELQKRMLNMFK
jgi:hypothetical protein